MRNNLKEILNVKGLILDELSKRTDIDVPKLSRIQNDRIEPREDEVRKIAANLRLSIQKVFPGSQLKGAEGTNDADELFELQKLSYERRHEWIQFFERTFGALNSVIHGNRKSINLSVKDAKIMHELLIQAAERLAVLP